MEDDSPFTRIQIEVRERFESTPDRQFWIAIVTTQRGRCYSCTYAGDRPTEDQVRQAWIMDRQSFDPHCS